MTIFHSPPPPPPPEPLKAARRNHDREFEGAVAKQERASRRILPAPALQDPTSARVDPTQPKRRALTRLDNAIERLPAEQRTIPALIAAVLTQEK